MNQKIQKLLTPKIHSKIALIIIVLLSCQSKLCAQSFDSLFYENIKEFNACVGTKIMVNSLNDLKAITIVKDLVKGLNTQQIAIYSFCMEGYDTPFNIIIIENDSIDIYEISEINLLLRRIVDISKKYNDISTNRKDIKWINEILYLNKLALDESAFTPIQLLETRGHYKYHFIMRKVNKVKDEIQHSTPKQELPKNIK